MMIFLPFCGLHKCTVHVGMTENQMGYSPTVCYCSLWWQDSVVAAVAIIDSIVSAVIYSPFVVVIADLDIGVFYE